MVFKLNWYSYTFSLYNWTPLIGVIIADIGASHVILTDVAVLPVNCTFVGGLGTAVIYIEMTIILYARRLK